MSLPSNFVITLCKQAKSLFPQPLDPTVHAHRSSLVSHSHGRKDIGGDRRRVGAQAQVPLLAEIKGQSGFKLCADSPPLIALAIGKGHTRRSVLGAPRAGSETRIYSLPSIVSTLSSE